MGIFTKLLRDISSDLAYKIGMFAPLCFTYFIGMDLAEQLSKQYNIKKPYFKIFYNMFHYFLVFFWISMFMKIDQRIRKYYQHYHIIKSRKG